MTAKCIDNSYTWRNSLTINKKYKVLRSYDDPYAGYPMIEIVNNEGVLHPYRANRFEITDQ